MFTNTQRMLKKLPPGVLKQYREGLPRPSVIDDIAGVSLARTATLSVSPRYVDFRAGLGPLVFHHMNYCNGARGPHRPIVFRNVFRATNAGWKAAANRSVVQGRYGWQEPEGPELHGRPPLSFAVGTARKSEYLVVPPPSESHKQVEGTENLAQSGGRQTYGHQSRASIVGPSSSAQPRVAEPWRLGIAIDPHLPTTQQTLAQRISVLREKEMLVDALSDCFLLPWQSLIVDVTAPSELIDMCRRANVNRAKQQSDAGLRTRMASENHAAEGFGLQSAASTIRVAEGDVLFLPSGFSFQMSRPVGYAAQDGLSHAVTQRAGSPPLSTNARKGETSLQRWGVGDAPKRTPDEIVCARVRYKRYPRLSDAQARVYMPADFTIGRLEPFYAGGGNALIPKYT